MSPLIDPGHDGRRRVLRVLGPAILLGGLLLTVVGFASFFSAATSAFGSGFEPAGVSHAPDKFWCAFLGLPLLGLGAMLCRTAYLGAMSRYVASEIAPVGTDLVNYMAAGTQGAVRDVASAVGDGLRGVPVLPERGVHCAACQAQNEASANFCKACGAALPRNLTCPGCGKAHDAEARFCSGCGAGLAPGS